MERRPEIASTLSPEGLMALWYQVRAGLIMHNCKAVNLLDIIPGQTAYLRVKLAERLCNIEGAEDARSQRTADIRPTTKLFPGLSQFTGYSLELRQHALEILRVAAELETEKIGTDADFNAWGLTNCANYIAGLDQTCKSDHRKLQDVFQDRVGYIRKNILGYDR